MASPSSASKESSSGDGGDLDGCSTREGFRIGYLSDVEGHWDYFLDYVERSNVLSWEEAERPPSVMIESEQIKFRRLALRPGARFVYGGDAVDKGPGDIRIVRALASLKSRYRDRVHLLVGNRDLNKLRLPSELSESDMTRDVDDIPKPFWNEKAKSLREYLENTREEKSVDGAKESLDDVNTRAERLRYMFRHTLGCPDTFEFRREEVRLLKQIYGEYPPDPDTHDVTPLREEVKDSTELILIGVSDEEVVDSFLYEMGPEGSLRQYLHLSSIAAIVGNTIFVHGAIDRLTMKYVPSPTTKFELPKSLPPPFEAPYAATPTDGKIIENVHEWVQNLNSYLHRGLDDFVARPEWNEERTSRGGESVLAIQCRPAMWGRSVVCNSYADGGVIATPDAEAERKRATRAARERSDPVQFEGIASDAMDPEPAGWLSRHGIRRVVVGHKPTGDCPAVLSHEYHGVEVVAVDTSYSRRRDLAGDNDGTAGEGEQFGERRGRAIAVVEIAGEDASSRNWLETSGVLACGTEYSNRFPILGGPDDDGGEDDDDDFGDRHLGRRLSDGWWVKAAVPPNYHLCRGSGRFVEYDIRPMEDVVDDLRLVDA